MLFAITAEFEKARRKDHKQFYCPAGCSNFYSQENESERLRRENERLRQDQARLCDEIGAANRRADAAERSKKRIEKRVHAGVCLDCNRTFANMARHMETKHGGIKCDAPKLKVVK